LAAVGVGADALEAIEPSADGMGPDVMGPDVMGTDDGYSNDTVDVDSVGPGIMIDDKKTMYLSDESESSDDDSSNSDTSLEHLDLDATQPFGKKTNSKPIYQEDDGGLVLYKNAEKVSNTVDSGESGDLSGYEFKVRDKTLIIDSDVNYPPDDTVSTATDTLTTVKSDIDKIISAIDELKTEVRTLRKGQLTKKKQRKKTIMVDYEEDNGTEDLYVVPHKDSRVAKTKAKTRAKAKAAKTKAKTKAAKTKAKAAKARAKTKAKSKAKRKAAKTKAKAKLKKRTHSDEGLFESAWTG
jgi:hypothetical protein